MLVFLSKTNVPVVNTLSDYMLMVIILQDIIAKTSDWNFTDNKNKLCKVQYYIRYKFAMNFNDRRVSL